MGIQLTSADKSVIRDPFMVVVSLSTTHLTRKDVLLLETSEASPKLCPNLIGAFAYGWFMETNMEDSHDVEMREYGFSEGLTDLLKALDKREIFYVCFDQDGCVLDGFPTFDW